MGYRERLGRDIERWQSEGLIDAPTAQALAASSAAAGSRGGFDLPKALALMGALLVGAGILSLVASNWGVIDRPVRVACLVLLIWGGFIAGAWRLGRGDPVFGHALLLTGAAAYGAGILLLGQMYSLHGSSFDALMAWTIGTVVGALLMRSGPLAAGAAVLSVLTLLTEPEWPSEVFWGPILIGPLLLGAAWIATHRAGGAVGRHVVLVGIVVWVARLGAELSLDDWTGLVVAGLGGAAYWLSTRLPALTGRYTRLATSLPGYGLACAGGGLLVHQLMTAGPDDASGTMAAIVTGTVWCVLAIATAVFALLDRGQQHAGVRWVSYGVFALAIAVLALDVIGSRLSTALLFALCGIIVLGLAWLVVRTERRIRGSGPPSAPGRAATSGATP